MSGRLGKAAKLGIVAAALAAAALTPNLAHAEADTFGFGSGHAGNLVVTAPNTVVNAYAAVTAVIAANATTITVDATTGFGTGDLVMIWKSTGLGLGRLSGSQITVPMDGDATGTFEFARVKSAAGTTITLTAPMVSGFAANQTQVVRVPEYDNLGIVAGASIAATPWNGAKGGIVVLFAASGVFNAGTVGANGVGLRGGLQRQDTTIFGCAALDGPVSGLAANTTNALAGGAKKGEGLFPNSYSTDTTSDATNALGALYNTYGYGNVSSGGGGGDCHNSGGAGGGHGGLGGTGGHTYDGDVGLLTDGERPFGGKGGAIIQYTATARMVMGGGGGAGEDNDDKGTGGAAGGGVVFVRAKNLTGNGVFAADGANAANATVAPYDGAGGGGSGGIVVVRVNGGATCSAVHAAGGAGGNARDQHGPGGGGAGGYVLVQTSTDECGNHASENGGGAGNDILDDGGTDGHYGATGGGNGQTLVPPVGGYAPAPCDINLGECGGCTDDSFCRPGDTCDIATGKCLLGDGGVDDGGLYIPDSGTFDASIGDDGGESTDGGHADGGRSDGGSFGDGGSGLDGGNGGDNGIDLGLLEGGGCGCSTPGNTAESGAGFLGVAIGALAFLRKRTKRK